MELPLQEAGLACARSEVEGVVTLVITDAAESAVTVRNRGGEALGALLKQDRKACVLDLRKAKMSDADLSQVCLALRATNQLEELYLSEMGHTGLEFVVGIVRRCNRLRVLHLQVKDVPTMQTRRKYLEAEDYDTSGYTAAKKEGEEEEGQDDDEDAKPQESVIDRLKELMASNDKDYGDDQEEAPPPPPTALPGILEDFVAAVASQDNLLEVQLVGENIPEDLSIELQTVVKEHKAKHAAAIAAKEETHIRSAHAALGRHVAELDGVGEVQGASAVLDILGAGGSEEAKTQIGIRSYVNRRLFAALGAALFECQRFKAKENEAVATPAGEMAFLAMHLRQHLEKEEEKKAQRMQPGS